MKVLRESVRPRDQLSGAGALTEHYEEAPLIHVTEDMYQMYLFVLVMYQMHIFVLVMYQIYIFVLVMYQMYIFVFVSLKSGSILNVIDHFAPFD